MNIFAINRVLSCYFIFLSMLSFAVEPQLDLQSIDTNMYTIKLAFNLTEHNFIFKDYITIATDSPDLKLSPWQSSIEPVPFYDTATKTTKKIFNQPVTFTLQATSLDNRLNEAHLQVTYYENATKNIKHAVLPLALASTHESTTTALQLSDDNQTITTTPSPLSDSSDQKKSASWSTYLADLIKTQESYSIRLLLALLLGVLLSLTPCIYPMIPITVGILHAQGRSSVMHNILISCAYTTGVATTFALLGLCAAFTGQLFGSLLASPIIILGIVALLIYLGGSMIGWYELYIPRWMQQSNNTVRGGSYLSVFLFGAISGTIASPCLSPGLLLLLTIVTTLNNLILGFALLFAFGIGTSLPLLIIGSFSSSLHLLPHAGMWMVEIKKLFGFIMFGMCFYFLNTIVSWPIILVGLTMFLMSVGVYYIYDATRELSTGKTLKNMIGMICIIAATVLLFQSYKAIQMRHEMAQSIWLNNYTLACEQAEKEQKKILLDIGAPFCSLCKAIDKKILNHADFHATLNTVIPVKIEHGGTSDVQAQTIQKKFNIIGVPTLLLIDAKTQTEIKRWGSEIYEQTAQSFASELQTYLNV